MKKTVRQQPCNNSLDLDAKNGYHKNSGSRNASKSEKTMCEDLEATLKAQEELGSDMSKGATIALKAALNTIKRLRVDFKSYTELNDQRWQALDKRHEVLAENMKKLQDSVNAYISDATKYKLIVDIAKALFGSPKKTITTLIVVAVIFGLVKLDTIIELVKAVIM